MKQSAQAASLTSSGWRVVARPRRGGARSGASGGSRAVIPISRLLSQLSSAGVLLKHRQRVAGACRSDVRASAGSDLRCSGFSASVNSCALIAQS